MPSFVFLLFSGKIPLISVPLKYVLRLPDPQQLQHQPVAQQAQQQQVTSAFSRYPVHSSTGNLMAANV
jgi:hypothetical protein